MTIVGNLNKNNAPKTFRIHECWAKNKTLGYVTNKFKAKALQEKFILNMTK